VGLGALAEEGDDVVGFDDADEAVGGVDDGEGAEVVLVEELGDLVFVLVGAAGDDAGFGEDFEAGFRAGEYEAGEGDDAAEDFGFVEEIDFGDGFGVAFEAAEGADAVGDGGGAGDGDVLSGHAAGGGVLAEFEEFADFLALLGVHFFEDGLGAVGGEFGEEVGGGGGVHFLDDAGGGFEIEGFDEGFLEARLDFFEGVGGNFLVEGAEDGFALGGGEVFEDVGDVGGVELGEALVFDLELDAAGGVDFDEVDEVPGDDAGGEADEERVEEGFGQEAVEDAAGGSAEADFDFGDAEVVAGVVAGGPAEVDVVDADDFAAVDVDDLAVEEVLAEEDEVFVALEGSEGGIGAELEGAGRGPADVVGGDDFRTAAGFDDETGDAAGFRAGFDGDVAEATAEATVQAGDGGAEQRGEGAVSGSVDHEMRFRHECISRGFTGLEGEKGREGGPRLNLLIDCGARGT
jgi:hypothetical protein